MGVSALAERRDRQAYRARVSRLAAGLLQSADAIAVLFISVTVFRSCKFLDIFAVYRSYYVAKGRRMNGVTYSPDSRELREAKSCMKLAVVVFRECI